MKHIATIRGTGSRVAVLFDSLPEKPDNALVADIEVLPLRLEAAMSQAMNSDAAGRAQNLGEALATVHAPNNVGASSYLLRELHEGGYIRAIPRSQLDLPSTGIPVQSQTGSTTNDNDAELFAKFKAFMKTQQESNDDVVRRLGDDIISGVNQVAAAAAATDVVAEGIHSVAFPGYLNSISDSRLAKAILVLQEAISRKSTDSKVSNTFDQFLTAYYVIEREILPGLREVADTSEPGRLPKRGMVAGIFDRPNTK